MFSENYAWLRSPKTVSLSNHTKLNLTEEKLINICNDGPLKLRHNDFSLDKFWIYVNNVNPRDANKAPVILWQFSTFFRASWKF